MEFVTSGPYAIELEVGLKFSILWSSCCSCRTWRASGVDHLISWRHRHNRRVTYYQLSRLARRKRSPGSSIEKEVVIESLYETYFKHWQDKRHLCNEGGCRYGLPLMTLQNGLVHVVAKNDRRHFEGWSSFWCTYLNISEPNWLKWETFTNASLTAISMNLVHSLMRTVLSRRWYHNWNGGLRRDHKPVQRFGPWLKWNTLADLESRIISYFITG